MLVLLLKKEIPVVESKDSSQTKQKLTFTLLHAKFSVFTQEFH